MAEIRLLPEQEERVETGAVQFGDDWPGVFIRGDDAFFFAHHLRLMLDTPDLDIPWYSRTTLNGLHAVISRALVGHGSRPTKPPYSG
jgi:hypothetical protein